jgi:hypothetical protein
MNKHTPGPWEWFGPNLLCGDERQSEDILKSADDGKPYGHHSALIEHHWDADVAKANARLIAAAPTMYEALVMVRDADEDCKCDGLPTIPSSARAKINAAIAKAEAA